MSWDERRGQFEVVSVESLRESGSTSLGRRIEHFDFVAVATGQYSQPNYEPFEEFKGEQMHSRTWPGVMEPDLSQDKKTVVVIGAGSSGQDIVLLLLKFGAASKIYWSCRSC